jgi:ribosome biogenesis GTPase A
MGTHLQHTLRNYKLSDAGRPERSALLDILDRLIVFLDESCADFSGDSKRVRELKERLITERFHLAVLGQFKRGKSTLINALIGDPILPTSVLPLTSIPTFLAAGSRRLIRIFFQDGQTKEFTDLAATEAADILITYVTEERNPKNKLAVSWVEVEHPASFLNWGVVLIDTPGIGSTFRHNTEATLAFLPQCDAALFVVSADPPITEIEVEFLQAVQAKVPRLFFIMNKTDYLATDESDRAVEFLRKVVKESVALDDQVSRVSARQGLQAKVNQDEALWQASGVATLEERLLEFFRKDKGRTLQVALATKTLDVVADTIMHIRLQRRSLEIPLEDLEKRVQILDEKVKEAERERITIGDLLAGDRKRTVDFLEEQAEETRKQARRYLDGLIGQTLQGVESLALVERRAQERLAKEIPVFFERKLRSLSETTDARLQEVLKPYEERADRLMETIRRTAAELFEVPYHAPESARALERTHRPYWVTYNWSTLISPVPEGFFDRFLPAGARRRRIQKRLSVDTEALAVRNVENVRWATLRNLDDAFRHFGSELDERLQETTEATRGAIESARARRRADLQTTGAELRNLQRKEAELAELEQSFLQLAALGEK